MSWDLWYMDVWDAIVGIVKTALPELADFVYYTEKQTPAEAPCIWVAPDAIAIAPISFQKSQHSPDFLIIVKVINDDPKLGFQQCLEYLGTIHDALVADRNLNHLVWNLEATSIEPYWNREGIGIEGHVWALRVRVKDIR